MANQLFYGSICLTDILENAKKKHSAFLKVESNGKIYFNARIWLNDEPDKFGNVMSVQLSSKKEKVEEEGKVYLGNFKKSEPNEKPVSDSDISNIIDESDLPF